MHPEALGGGVDAFNEAVQTRVCPFLNELGEVALNEMRTVYEELDAGNYEALGEMAERLATAVEQKKQLPDTNESKRSDIAVVQKVSVIAPERLAGQGEVVRVQKLNAFEDPSELTSAADIANSIDRLQPSLGEGAYGDTGAAQYQETNRLDAQIARIGQQPDRAVVVNESVAVASVEESANHRASYGAQASSVATEMQAQRMPEYESASASGDEETVAIEAAAYNEVPLPSFDSDVVASTVAEAMEQPYMSPEPITWADELSDMLPHEVYEDFITTIQAFVLEPHSEDLPTPVEGDELRIDPDRQEIQQIPLIVVTVAERFTELESEEKETCVPAAQQVVAVLGELHRLDAESEPVSILEAEVRCEAAVAELFEALAIEYSEEEVRQFAGFIMRPDFQPVTMAVAEKVVVKADLEKDGTREANWSLKLAQGWADAKKHVKQALGGSALFHAYNSKAQYDLAA